MAKWLDDAIFMRFIHSPFRIQMRMELGISKD